MMRIALIGRSELLYDTALLLKNSGYDIPLIITAKEAPEYTKTAKDFESLAKEWHCEFVQTPRILEALENIQKHTDIDVAVSVNYSGIIPQEIIDQFPLGVLNAHGGDLPRYRGNACQAWAILNAEDKIGLCIHRMIGGELDNGDIIARDYLNIDINTKVTEAWNWMTECIPTLYLESIKELEADPKYILEAQSKDWKDALRCYPRRPEDGKIDWSSSAEDILRLINACNRPYAGAFCEYSGSPLIIWDAELATPENFVAAPGQIASIHNDYVEITTGEGKIRLKEIEYEGKVMCPKILFKSLRGRVK